MIVMISFAFALVGAVWFICMLGYDMSIAVGVGFIALAGVAAPMIGGMVSSTILTLIVIPAVYAAWKTGIIKRERNSNV